MFLAKNNSTLQEDFHKLFLLMLFWTSVVPNSKKWVNAISLGDGNIYVKLLIIYEILSKQASKKHITEICSYFDAGIGGFDAVAYSVSEYLRQHDAIAESVRRPFFGRMFNFVDDSYDRIHGGFFMPIKVEIFGVPLEELERRKLNIEWLTRIKKAIPGHKKRRTVKRYTSNYGYQG